VKVYEAIVKGENIPEPGIPESFKVLVKEMQSLCLNVEVLAGDGSAIDMKRLRRRVLPAARNSVSISPAVSPAASKRSEAHPTTSPSGL
jgi:DNA-directed RNA polymerase subunit beta